MPQSLTIDSSVPTGSQKRQRSADSREVQPHPNSAGRKWSSSGRLKPNVKVPVYLDKTKVEIGATFQDLEWKQRFRLFHALENPITSPFRVDRSMLVLGRNRYGNVQPWSQSRIRLKQPIDGSDYVNASPIVLKSRLATTDSRTLHRDANLDALETHYIASQGPKDETISHFWHMVMQETTGDVGVIVMLTQLYEGDKEKCAQYIPLSTKNPTLHFDTSWSDTEMENDESKPDNARGTVTLTSLTTDLLTHSQVRTLDLTISGTTKTIHHYLFDGWPDFGKPEASGRRALVELARVTHGLAEGSPRIVHCSAGVGRTGAFIALDFLSREIEHGRLLEWSNLPVLKSPPIVPPQFATLSSMLSTDARPSFVTTPEADSEPELHSDPVTVLDDDTDIEPSSAISATSRVETWGKSDPPKVITPTAEDFGDDPSQSYNNDLIYMTVNSLREQRMMMVMNELQYSFLYEAIREVFWNKYRARPEGAVVRGSSSIFGVGGSEASQQLHAVYNAKIDIGRSPEDQNVDLGTLAGDIADLPRGKTPKVDGRREASETSEAETEIMDDGLASSDAAQMGDHSMTDSGVGMRPTPSPDPYQAVAPETIQKGLSRLQ